MSLKHLVWYIYSRCIIIQTCTRERRAQHSVCHSTETLGLGPSTAFLETRVLNAPCLMWLKCLALIPEYWDPGSNHAWTWVEFSGMSTQSLGPEFFTYRTCRLFAPFSGRFFKTVSETFLDAQPSSTLSLRWGSSVFFPVHRPSSYLPVVTSHHQLRHRRFVRLHSDEVVTSTTINSVVAFSTFS